MPKITSVNTMDILWTQHPATGSNTITEGQIKLKTQIPLKLP